MASTFQFRRGTAQEWATKNPILAEGELGIELDTLKFKIGTGLSYWNDLAYVSGPAGPAGPPGDAASINAVYPLNYNPATGELSFAQTTRVEYRALTASEVLQKRIELMHPLTDPSSVSLDIRNADAAPWPGLDFTVIGQAISWAGKGLDGLLEADDKVRVIYH
jgi:hypothetical protein